MFVNRINNKTNNRVFKGFNYEKNSVGETVRRFNYPHDPVSQNCIAEFYRVKPNPNAKFGYEILQDNPIHKVKIQDGGSIVNLLKDGNISNNEPFAYRILVNGIPYADTGVKYDKFTLVSGTATQPTVQGPGYISAPDTQFAGYYYTDFDSEHPYELRFDENAQLKAENSDKVFSTRSGGNLAGLEASADYWKDLGVKYAYNLPIQGGDSVAGHGYWNQDNYQISDRVGNIETYGSYIKRLYKNGIVPVYDATFTSEGLQGKHFQYALRWADKNPQAYYWFKMSGIKDSQIGLGIIPKNDENFRVRVINPTYIYNPETNSKEINKNYDSKKPTYIETYDSSLVTKEQLQKDEPIGEYKKTAQNLDIITHDDTLMPYCFEILPKEYEKRIDALIRYNRTADKPLDIDSAEGAKFMSTFYNFKIDIKTEGGSVTWDANTDMEKLSYHVSGYDEKLNQAVVSRPERDYIRKMQRIGGYEVQDLNYNAGIYWVQSVKDIQTIYTARTIAKMSTKEGLQELILREYLPKETELSEEAIKNIIDGNYNFVPKQTLDKDDVTIKALMKLPLDALEVAQNTSGILSTSYFSNRAISEETLGKSRFDLMKDNNPQLLNEYANTYNKVNDLYKREIKNFADEIVKRLNDISEEKLINSSGEYTEYGEYVMDLMGKDIAKYAFLKAIAGSKLKTKVLSNGEITYDYIDLKKNTTIQALGIVSNNPADEAAALEKHIANGLTALTDNDIDYVAKSMAMRLEGTNTLSFRLAEAMIDKAGLGLAIRLDAAKDIIDMDAVRNGSMTFDEAWQRGIDFWKKFVSGVKEISPSTYVVAEITDIPDLFEDVTGARGYDMVDVGNKFFDVNDAMIKFLNETGITSEAAYSYFFTDLLKTFSPEFESGSYIEDSTTRATNFIWRFEELLRTRSADYIRNIFSFAGNHDKPRTLHGLSVDMGLFFANITNVDENAYNKDVLHNYRVDVMKELTNSDKEEDLPIEARLNMENKQYFLGVSTKAAAMSKLIRQSINDSLTNSSVTEEEIKYLKEALVDLTNGNYMGEASNVAIPSINIPALMSVENALDEILKGSAITLTDAEKQAIIQKANSKELISKYVLRDNAQRNQALANALLGSKADLNRYHIYTISLASLIKEAYENIKGSNVEFNNAIIEFAKKYDSTFVETNRTPLPTHVSQKNSNKKDGYAAKDIEKAIKMLIEQAEYRAREDGKLGENEHFSHNDTVLSDVYRTATEPGVQKLAYMMAFLAALPGNFALYGGDELGMTGWDEKAKNIYLQNRNALVWSQLSNSPLKEYRTQIFDLIWDIMKIRSRVGLSALNNGTPYLLSTENNKIPAYMMQNAEGDVVISAFNAYGIQPQNRIEGGYVKAEDDKTINNDNLQVPVVDKTQIKSIILRSADGSAIPFALPIDTEFVNSNDTDNTVYKVVKNGENYEIQREDGLPITFTAATATMGATMILMTKAAKEKALKKEALLTQAREKLENLKETAEKAVHVKKPSTPHVSPESHIISRVTIEKPVAPKGIEPPKGGNKKIWAIATGAVAVVAAGYALYKHSKNKKAQNAETEQELDIVG